MIISAFYSSKLWMSVFGKLSVKAWICAGGAGEFSVKLRSFFGFCIARNYLICYNINLFSKKSDILNQFRAFGAFCVVKGHGLFINPCGAYAEE